MKKLINNYYHSNPVCKDFAEIDGNTLPKFILHFFCVSAALREIFHDNLLISF